jgi:hypothetical protein|tara:strand:- start:39 stop:452 length:414 start_codon:yes stop_codon:yes gene_type:complete
MKVEDIKSEMKREVESVQYFKRDRKALTVTQLRKEMKDRNIGYMSNWTKNVLMKRLDEEDRRDVTLEKIMREKHSLENQPERERAALEKRIRLSEGEYEAINEEIDILINEKNELCIKRASIVDKIKRLKGALEILS